MSQSNLAEVRREKKKSFLLHEISALVHRVTQDERDVAAVYITKVDLSRDTGICYVYFSTHEDKPSKQDVFDRALSVLKLYKPSIRSALAKSMNSRYTPQLVFLFDKKKEKVDRINKLLDKVHQEITAQEN